MYYMDLDVCHPRKAIKLNHSPISNHYNEFVLLNKIIPGIAIWHCLFNMSNYMYILHSYSLCSLLVHYFFPVYHIYIYIYGGGWGCEVSCGGHHRPRGKTTTVSALDGAVCDIAQILAYLVHNMSRSQLYLGFGHFGWLFSYFDQ